MTRSMQYRIWFRTMRFVVYQWAFPLVIGVCIGAVSNLTGMVALAEAVAQACQP